VEIGEERRQEEYRVDREEERQEEHRVEREEERQEESWEKDRMVEDGGLVRSELDLQAARQRLLEKKQLAEKEMRPTLLRMDLAKTQVSFNYFNVSWYFPYNKLKIVAAALEGSSGSGVYRPG